MSHAEKPRGREDVRTALIEAGARLFAERGRAGVSVRDVAREAGVNHGLVHRHFGSKAGLLRDVMADLASRVAGGMGQEHPDESLAGLLADIFGATSEEIHWRILARAMLDGDDPDDLQDDYPVVARMLTAARRGTGTDLSPEALVTLLLAGGLGALVFEPYLKAATGQDDNQWKATRRELFQLVQRSVTDTSGS